MTCYTICSGLYNLQYIAQCLSCGIEKQKHASEALRALLTRLFPVPRGFNARNLSLKLRSGSQDSTQRSGCHHLVWSRFSVWRQFDLWAYGLSSAVCSGQGFRQCPPTLELCIHPRDARACPRLVALNRLNGWKR